MFAVDALGDVMLVKHASRHEQVSMPLTAEIDSLPVNIRRRQRVLTTLVSGSLTMWACGNGPDSLTPR